MILESDSSTISSLKQYDGTVHFLFILSEYGIMVLLVFTFLLIDSSFIFVWGCFGKCTIVLRMGSILFHSLSNNYVIDMNISLSV